MIEGLFSNQFQWALQGISLVLGLVMLVVALVNIRASATWIMLLVCFYVAHLFLYYGTRFYCLARGTYDALLFSDWSTVLRLHGTLMLLTLTVSIVEHRKLHGFE